MSKHSLSQSAGTLVQQLRTALSLFWRWEARLKGVRFEGRVTFIGRPLVSVAADSRLLLKNGVVVASSVRANPLACFQPSVLRTLSAGAQLVLGEKVGLSGAVLCAGRAIEIGEGTILGSGAMILDNDFHLPEGEWGWRNEYQANASPIKIGRGVFIGARAIVLKGVTIGDRAVVGAGAVVTKDVPAGGVAAGNPARLVGAAPQLPPGPGARTSQT